MRTISTKMCCRHTIEDKWVEIKPDSIQTHCHGHATRLLIHEEINDAAVSYDLHELRRFYYSTGSSSPPVTPAGVEGSNEAPPPLSVTSQPLDGAPAVVLRLHFCFHSSSPGCLWSTTLPLSHWGPATGLGQINFNCAQFLCKQTQV